MPEAPWIYIYIWIMRDAALLQLIFIYYVLPGIGIRLIEFPQRSLPYTTKLRGLFCGDYDTFLPFRLTKYEAAKVLKFTPVQTIRLIILPQVVKIVLPSVFNEVMTLVKDVPLVYALGISDLILA